MARTGFSRKQLGQIRPADTTAASIYSPGADDETRVFSVVVCNTTGSPVRYRLFHDEDGTTYDQTTALHYDVALPANTTDVVTFGDGDNGGIWMNDSSGNIAGRTSVASAITFTAYGEENIE